MITFGLVFVAVALVSTFKLTPPSTIFRKELWWQVALLLYGVCLFIYDYHYTGGSSGVAVVGGQYLATYKSKMLRVIRKEDFYFYPTLWLRVMSAFIGWSAVSIFFSFRHAFIPGAANKYPID